MKKILFILLGCIALSSCGAGSANQISAGNITNYGYVLADGGDIYYTKVAVREMNYYSNIYKYNTVSEKDEIIAEVEADYFNEMNAYLTLHDGYLYFLPYFLHESQKESSPNIYRVKPDGENIEPEALFENDISCTFMQIKDGVLYYYDDGEETLYSMNPDGTNRRAVCNAVMDSISIDGGSVYFADYELLYHVSLKGGEPELIFDFSALDEAVSLKDIIISGEYIYYLEYDGARVGRIRTDGKGRENIYTAEPGGYLEFFNVDADKIYIVIDGYGKEDAYAILEMNAGGGEVKTVVSDAENFGDILPLAIWGDTIYFSGMYRFEPTDSKYVWFTVNKSGGNLTAWQPFSVER